MDRRRALRVARIDRDPFHTLPFWNVSHFREPVRTELPFVRARVDPLPGELRAIVATADLQGREAGLPGAVDKRLLGQALAEELESLASVGAIPPLAHVGVVLAGDLYTTADLDRRGTSGDVRRVWRGFAERCPKVRAATAAIKSGTRRSARPSSPAVPRWWCAAIATGRTRWPSSATERRYSMWTSVW